MESRGLVSKIQKFCLHDGPGIRTTVFLKGCGLKCRWCSNPESQAGSGAGLETDQRADPERLTPDEVVAVCIRDKEFYEESGGGVTLSGGEPLNQPDFAYEILSLLKEEKIHTAVETAGYASQDVFYRIAEKADLLLFDVKHYDEEMHIVGTGVSNKRILQNLEAAAKCGFGLLVRIPVIPDYNNSYEDAKLFSELLNAIGVSRVQLLPFHQFGENKYALTGREYYMKDVRPLDKKDLLGMKDMFIRHGIECFI